jgi:TetR/AcrR family transcriptional regulator, mexJK operon transcriptional repressor
MSTPKKAVLGRPKNPEKRQAILQAAAELFPQNGYDGVSMMEIADKAGVSKLTLYSHFTDKEDLFTQSVIDCCEQQLPASTFKLAPGLNLEQALGAIGTGFLELIMDAKSITLHRMIIQQTGADSTHAELFFKAGPARMLAEMRSFLEQAAGNGALAIAEPGFAAEHFFCLLKGLVYMRVLMGISDPPGKTEREAHVREVVALFLRAYRPGQTVRR